MMIDVSGPRSVVLDGVLTLSVPLVADRKVVREFARNALRQIARSPGGWRISRHVSRDRIVVTAEKGRHCFKSSQNAPRHGACAVGTASSVGDVVPLVVRAVFGKLK